MAFLQHFIRLSRPLFLLGVAVLYALGTGIAHYMGATIDWQSYLLGQAWVTLLQLSAQYLDEYFNTTANQANPNRTFLTGGSGALGEGKLSRRVALMAALTCLAVLSSVTVIVISILSPPPEAYLIMGLAFLGAFFYSVPPVKLDSSGYGELVATILAAYLAPAFAFLLQTGELHRLVAMTAFPLAAAQLSMLLAFELPDYATDLKFQKRTLMIRLGWQNGMALHNILVLSAFLLIVVARIFGYPKFAMLAGLLPLPLGLFQIWQIRNIASGARPNWKILTIGSAALFVSMAYLLGFAFWTN
jgi:1,4-dihydroxy-2-naphthoate octaprenyltransferase